MIFDRSRQNYFVQSFFLLYCTTLPKNISIFFLAISYDNSNTIPEFASSDEISSNLCLECQVTSALGLSARVNESLCLCASSPTP